MAAGARLIVLGNPPHRGIERPMAEALGPARAARLMRAMLMDTWSAVSAWITTQPDVDLVLANAGPTEEYPLLSPTPSFQRVVQGELGRRMATLIVAALGQRDAAVLLASTAAGVPIASLAEAFAMLGSADVVLGPSPEGTLWCMAVRGGPQAVHGNTWLDGIDWSRVDAVTRLEERCRRLGLRTARAAEWTRTILPHHVAPLRALLEAEPERAPETAAELRRPADEQLLSIVIPTLQESTRLDDCLRAVQTQPGPLEIVVADGGSTDKGPERALAAGAVVVVTGPGRGRQLKVGAQMATGEILIFLHVDARLPPGATDLVRAALADPQVEAGAFLTRTVRDPNRPNWAGPLLRLADLRARLSRIPHGEQALFVRTSVYDAVGGFRPLPVCEDQDLARRLAARRRLVKLQAPVTVSGRSIQVRPLRTLFVHNAIPSLFRLGVDPMLLAKLERGR
jgi:glycosyltransferase A (GT-A) superfamily protein (DUF2064 family)